ncbi:MAG: hypothetical protein U5L72_19595 [Bacteroidales bacterium]|nr:hypothetical protein [Bacteroidales bacterium]
MMMTILKWFARVLAILAILFMLMFSLDVFGGNESFPKQLLGFLIHNIPAFGLIIALVIAWRYEITSGILFVLSFVALGIFFKSFAGNINSLVIIAPFLDGRDYLFYCTWNFIAKEEGKLSHNAGSPGHREVKRQIHGLIHLQRHII